MKRVGNIYSKIISIENLQLADLKARKGKINTYGVQVHDKNREQNIYNLHIQLQNKTFKTSEYTKFTIYEPKEREIFRLPYYPDRIVHHAIMNILEPIWYKIFTYNTYSCIKNRGIEKCAAQVSKIIKRYENRPLYCLKIDIQKFYPSIDHEIMKSIVRRSIKDKDVLYLLDEIIDSAEGLPIGNYLSQYLANLYLAYFMHFVNEKLHYIIHKSTPFEVTEYADDIVFFSDNKKDLHKAFKIIQEYLSVKLKLTIKSNYQIFPIATTKYSKDGRGLDYVGYVFFKKQKLLRKKIKKTFSKITKKTNQQSNLSFKEYKMQICPWLEWIKHSNSKRLLNKLIKPKYYESILRQLSK